MFCFGNHAFNLFQYPLTILTYSFPMHPSVFWCFQGVEKGCIGNEWVKLIHEEALNLPLVVVGVNHWFLSIPPPETSVILGFSDGFRDFWKRSTVWNRLVDSLVSLECCSSLKSDHIASSFDSFTITRWSWIFFNYISFNCNQHFLYNLKRVLLVLYSIIYNIVLYIVLIYSIILIFFFFILFTMSKMVS